MSATPQDLAATLRRRHRAELDAARIAAITTRTALTQFVRERELLDRVWLIGSLAWGGFDETSDVDVVVTGLTVEDLAPLWDHLTACMRRRVDLLRIEDLPAAFQERVLRQGVRLGVA